MASVEAVELNVVDHRNPRAPPKEFEHTGPEFGIILSQPGELSSWNLWRAACVEFMGMVFFLFFTLGTVNATQSYHQEVGENAITGFEPARHWQISSVFGFMISILVYACAPFSGGNLNPAVSFSLAISKKISLVRFLVYVVFQMFGAALGAYLCKAVFDHDDGKYNYATNEIAAPFTSSQAFLGELMGTALLVGTVLSAVDANNGHPERVNMKQSLGVAMIGTCVTMAHCVLIPVTNCSINPARAFGASLVANEFVDHAVMWLGPLAGGLVAVIVYEGVFKDRPTMK